MFSASNCFSKRPSRLGLGLVSVWILTSGLLSQGQADVILEPVKDNHIRRCLGTGTDTNYGGFDELWVRAGDGNWSPGPEPKSIRTILQFDLSGITGPVAEATLGLYYFGKWSNSLYAERATGRTYEVRRLMNDWDEGVGVKTKKEGGAGYTTAGSSWTYRTNHGTTAEAWQSGSYIHVDDSDSLPPGHTEPTGWYPLPNVGGGDFSYTEYGWDDGSGPQGGADHWGGDEVWATAVVPADYGWMEWDITGLVNLWLADPASNHGLIVMDSVELWHRPEVYDQIYGTIDENNWHGWGARFYSREFADPALRPYLEITSASAQIPEPSTLILLALGLAGLVCWRRWKGRDLVESGARGWS